MVKYGVVLRVVMFSVLVACVVLSLVTTDWSVKSGVNSVVSAGLSLQLVTLCPDCVVVVLGVVNSAFVVMGVVGLAGHVQEQLQHTVLLGGFGEGLGSGQPGYQFWKARGSPSAH